MKKNQQIAKLFNLVNESEHNLTTPENIEAVEKKMLDLPQAECSVSHHFGAGVYIREVTIPAGVFSVGHYQNFEHMNNMIKGRVIMLNEDGTTSEVVAPIQFVGQPGRKVGFIIEEMVWQNIYPNPDNETDFNVLEEKYVTKTESWLDDNKAKNQLEYVSRHTDREDYKLFLFEIAATDEEYSKSFNIADSDFPEGSYSVNINKSNIQGRGVFSVSPLEADETIVPVTFSGSQTPAYKYLNHSMSPNSKLAMTKSGDINLIAIKNIRGCHGGDSGEELTIDYRDTISLSRSALCQ